MLRSLAAPIFQQAWILEKNCGVGAVKSVVSDWFWDYKLLQPAYSDVRLWPTCRPCYANTNPVIYLQSPKLPENNIAV